MKRPASFVAAILFWLIALAQLLRVLLRVEAHLLELLADVGFGPPRGRVALA